MFDNKPRGISFNKNALNIQLNTQQARQSPSEPSPPKLRSFPQNRFSEAPQPNGQIDGKPQLVSFRLPGEKKGLSSIDVLKEDENLETVASKLINLSTDKPKSRGLSSTDLLKEDENIDLKSTIQQVEPSKQQDESSIISKIPRLSTRIPIGNLINLQPSYLNKINPKPKQTKTQLATTVEEDEDDDEDIEDIDKSTSRDALFLVSDIAKDIYSYMFNLEEVQRVDEGFLQDQKIYTPKVRQRLVNWCIDIHGQLSLLPETTYMTIAVIDRFFTKFQVKQQSQVQLVAIGATLIASKYEEIYPPDVNDLIHLTQNAYTRREVMRIEIQILEELNFDLGRPVPLAFLRRFSKVAHCDLKTHTIAKYLMELSLCEYECSHWRPSLLAATALFVTLHLVRQGTPTGPLSSSSGLGLRRALSQSSANKQPQPQQQGRWTKSLVHYTRYSRKDLQGPAGILCKIVKRSQKNPQSYFCAKKHAQVVRNWTELKSARVDELIKLAEQ